MDEILLTFTKGQSLIQWVKATPHFISVTQSQSSEQFVVLVFNLRLARIFYSLKNNELID